MSALFKESPENAAKQIQTAIKQNMEQGLNTLHQLLDVLLDTSKLDSWNNMEAWLKALVTDGSSWENFAKKVREKDDSPFCGCVWTSDFVAYRCRTCATSPCMSLCAACFERGNHEGHDYNMFRSEAGGACDCGDPSVMNPAGFCPHHGPDRIKPQHTPSNFIASGKVVIERVLIAFFQILRLLSTKPHLTHEEAWKALSPEVKSMVSFLHELLKLGSPTINIVCDFLLSKTVYSNLLNLKGYTFLKDQNSSLFHHHRLSNDWFRQSLKSIRDPEIPPGIDRQIEFGNTRNYEKLIDELTFWMVKYDFSEPLILVVLNLLPNLEMKKEFSKAFICHYSRIARILNDSNNTDPLTNRIVHVSVQLFSNEEIAFSLAQNDHLIEIFLISLYNVLHMYMDTSRTNEADQHRYVSMTRGPRGRSHAYWPIASDFSNFLGHASVAIFFLSHEKLFVPWVRMMIPFCGMELINRAMDRHVEFEPHHMLNHYYMIRETCASPLFCLLDVLQDTSTVNHTMSLVRHFKSALNEFFEAIGNVDQLAHDQISFHYPIHRYITWLVNNAINKQGAHINDFNFTIYHAKRMMAHPLQILACTCEINNNMWVRNGIYIQTLALAYKQHLFSRFHIDADIFLLQMCMGIVPADYTIVAILKRFRVYTTLTMLRRGDPFGRICSTFPRQFPDSDRQPMMLEGALRLIVNLLSNRTLIGSTEEELMRREVTCLIACRPRTFSSLTENIAQCHEAANGMNRGVGGDVLRRVVNQVAVKKEARDAMEQTTYIIKPESWKLYDPIFTEQRILYKRDITEATKNYYQHLVKSGEVKQGSINQFQVWPPYQDIGAVPAKYGNLLKVLASDNLHSVIYIILTQFGVKDSPINESILSLAIHLLKSALKYSESLPLEETPGANNNEDQSYKMFDLWRSKNIWNKLVEQVYQKNNGGDNTGVFSTFQNCERGVLLDLSTHSSSVDHPQHHQSTSVDSSGATTTSILSQLIRIYNSHTKSYFQLPYDVFSTEDRTPPTLANTVANLLHYVAAHSPDANLAIHQICENVTPKPVVVQTNNTATDEDVEMLTDLQIRRKKAKEAREAMLRKIQQDSKNFMEKTQNMSEQEPTTAKTTTASTTTKTDEKSSSENKCVICLEGRKSPPNDVDTQGGGGAGSNSTLTVTSTGASTSGGVAEWRIMTSTDDEVEQMETTSVVYLDDDDDDDDIDDVEPRTDEASCYDFGLICFVQDSTVLGARRDSDGRIPFDSSSISSSSCRDSAASVSVAIKDLPYSSSNKAIEESVRIAQSRGIHISTCGHYVHQKCHDGYLRSIELNDRATYEESMNFGFACPICRQTFNFILPVELGDKRTDIWEMDTELVVMKLHKAICDKIPRFPDDNEQYFHSLLRFNMEQYLMQHQDENPSQDLLTSLVNPNPPLFDKRLLRRKIPLKDIFCLYLAVSLNQRAIDPTTEFYQMRQRLWTKWDKVEAPPPPPDVPSLTQAEGNTLPLLFCDPFSILLQIIPEMNGLTLDNFQINFHLAFRLAFVKSLISVLRKFSPEERKAWTSPTMQQTNTSQSLLVKMFSKLLTNLPADYFNQADSSATNNDVMFSLPGTVFTPRSVMAMVEEELIDFLKLSALLQYKVFEVNPYTSPSSQQRFDSEAKQYANYLGVFQDNVDRKQDILLHQCLQPTAVDILIRRWCAEAKSHITRANVNESRQLLSLGLTCTWKLPTIINMPTKYNTFFQHYRNRKCAYCKKVPSDPCVCLICGVLMCHKVDCLGEEDNSDTHQPVSPLYTTTRHARQCGAGTGIFVIVNHAYVFVMRPRRACIWGSLYLDENGEEDVGWKRGKPIFLKQQRLELLEKQWRRNLFDHVCKGWTPHNNMF